VKQLRAIKALMLPKQRRQMEKGLATNLVRLTKPKLAATPGRAEARSQAAVPKQRMIKCRALTPNQIVTNLLVMYPATAVVKPRGPASRRQVSLTPAVIDPAKLRVLQRPSIPRASKKAMRKLKRSHCVRGVAGDALEIEKQILGPH